MLLPLTYNQQFFLIMLKAFVSLRTSLTQILMSLRKGSQPISNPSAFPAIIPHPGDLDNASLVTSPPTFAFLCVPLHTHFPEGRLKSYSSFWNNHRFAEPLQKRSRGWLCTLHAASLHAPRLPHHGSRLKTKDLTLVQRDALRR